MRSEFFLYVYGAVCFGVILFNILYDMVMKRSEKRLKKRTDYFDRMISERLYRIKTGKKPDKKFLEYMKKVLSHTEGLMAFDAALKQHMKDENIGDFIKALGSVFVSLAYIYDRRESLRTAYFAYILGNGELRDYLPGEELSEIITGYVAKDSLYCRINAMRALFSFGNEEYVAKAVCICNKNQNFLHGKILQDGLLTFRGDHKKLIALLWKNFDSFGENIQTAILNYIRMKTGAYRNEMLNIMKDVNRGRETRLAAIRYLGKYPDERAKNLLISFLKDKDPVNREYAAVSAASLAVYDGADVTEVLGEAMHSHNWYVRYNSALSLEKKGFTFEELKDKVKDDKYAGDMLKYRLKEIKKTGERV